MGKQSVRSLWLIKGAFVALMGCANAGPVPTAEVLTQENLSEPDTVSEWLRKNPGGLEKKEAAFSYGEGLKYKSKKDWSAAAKSFGESAIRYPSPQVLTEYVTASLRMLGEIRARRGDTTLGVDRDMDYALLQYRSVMAADSVLDTLSEREKMQVEANIACLSDYLRTRQIPAECQPFEYYGMRP